MRVSTELFYRQFNNSLTTQQGNLSILQQQISTGKRILTAADDPVGAARALDIAQATGRLDQFLENSVFAEQRLGLEDATLSSVTNLLQRVNELAIAAGNIGAQSTDTYAAFEVEIEERLAELIELANTRDGNGEYLFAGFQGNTLPFSESGSSVVYNGDQGQQFIQVGANRNIATSDSGYDVFLNIRNGNGTFSVDIDPTNTGNGVISAGTVIDATTYQANDFSIVFTAPNTYDVVNNTLGVNVVTGATYNDGDPISFNGIQTAITGSPQTGDTFLVNTSRAQDIFTTLQNFINTVSTYPDTPAASAETQQSIQNVIADLDQALGNILATRTKVGARLNAVESANNENDIVKFELQKTLSSIQDVDFAEAISSLEFQLSTLEASQQTFAAIQRLSLFNFIR